MLTLTGEFEISSPRDFAPVPPKIQQARETYPVFSDPMTGELHTCIFWAGDQVTGFEYYGFSKAKGSFKNKKTLVFSGWKMEQTSFSCEFPRAMFTPDRFQIIEDPQGLGEKVLPPQHRTIGSSDTQPWTRVAVPFL